VASDGSVNIMFQFRWMGGSSPMKAGINTVVVQADAKGLGGGKGAKQLGDPEFINGAIEKILAYLRPQYPNVKLGKLGLSAFSGGYGPIWWALENKDKLIKQPDTVIVADGIHHSVKPGSAAMKPWVEYAQLAAKDPSKKFIVLHSAVDPQKYPSTTQTANYILDALGMQKSKADPNQYKSWNVTPTAAAAKGGFTVMEIPGGDEAAHRAAGQSLPYLWSTYLKDWNAPTVPSELSALWS
jgi:hypothetical protein